MIRVSRSDVILAPELSEGAKVAKGKLEEFFKNPIQQANPANSKV